MITALSMGRLFLVIQMGSEGEAEAEEVWDTEEEVAMWPRRHKQLNLNAQILVRGSDFGFLTSQL